MTSSIDQDIVVDHYPATGRSMRIAYVTETYPPEVNGVAMSTARLVAGLHDRHHDIQLIRPRQDGSDAAQAGPRLHEVFVRGWPIPRYPHLRMGAPSKRALIRLWSVQRPDVVHVATEGPLCWSALQAAAHLKLPTSSDFRTNFHAYSKHYGVGWLYRPIMAYLRKFHNRTQCTMVPTEGLRRELQVCGFDRLSVVARGVDTDKFDPAHRSDLLRQEWGAGPEDVVLLVVGRVAAEKNLQVLLDAFDQLRRVESRARLVIVGDGPMRAALQASAPHVHFAGQRVGLELATHYASADLFAFPSLTETFGNVTAEAMASGLPVVAFDYAAAALLIRTGDNGFLVPFGDAAAFVRVVGELARAVERRRAVGRQARLTATAYGWDAVVTKFEAVLRAVIQDHAPAVRGVPAGATPRSH